MARPKESMEAAQDGRTGRIGRDHREATMKRWIAAVVLACGAAMAAPYDEQFCQQRKTDATERCTEWVIAPPKRSPLRMWWR